MNIYYVKTSLKNNNVGLSGKVTENLITIPNEEFIEDPGLDSGKYFPKLSKLHSS